MCRLSSPLAIGLCVVGLTLGGCNHGGKPETATSPGPEPTTESTPVATDSPSTPAPTASPAPTPTASSAPTASPAPPAAGGTPINPPTSAQLIAQQPEAKINLRTQPDANSSAKGYGLVGDPVQLLRTATGTDGHEWYYVKFEQSGAEGWIRSDFINTSGRAQALPSPIVQQQECAGVMESLAFKAYYSNNRFQMLRFTNLETKSSFDSPLSPTTTNAQGQPVYTGQASPPTGGQYEVRLTDLSGGTPGRGSQVSVNYGNLLTGTGTCQ